MNKKITLRIDKEMFLELYSHLFSSEDEHGAVIAAGIVVRDNEIRLLAKHLFIAEDAVSYVPGTRGYRTLTPTFIAEKATFCEQENLCYLAIHNHIGNGDAVFSPTDLASHQRGYKAILDITGNPVGGLVFTKDHVAGDIWISKDEHIPLSKLTIIGAKITDIFPTQQEQPLYMDPIYNRQGLIYGENGQQKLHDIKVGIIGAGGAGSLLNELLSRLGVGEITIIDFDKIEPNNLPRVVGATHWDAKSWLVNHKFPLVKTVGKLLARHKLDIAKDVAQKANNKIKIITLKGDILDPKNANKFTNLDFIFLAADSMQARLLFNRIVFQYLIPGIQVGVKISLSKDKKGINDIYTAVRPVLPYAGGGCLKCNNWISSSQLQQEAITPVERKRQRYVDDELVHAPSVITLNALSASEAANDFMMMVTELYDEGVSLPQTLNFVRTRETISIENAIDSDCNTCSDNIQSFKARGDSIRLPVRQ